MLVTCIEVMRKTMHIRRESVENTMDILAEVDAPGTQMWQQFLKSGNLLFRKMTTIIDDDIDVRCFPFESLPKAPVCLVTDAYFHGVVFVCLAGRLDVDTVNSARGPEVILPHFQTSTTVDADFQDVSFLAPESAEVPVIDLKIMAPFPDAMTFLVGLKEHSQRIR